MRVQDPSFWPIHPTVERLWLWKKLSGSFEDETWPARQATDCFNCYCLGHAAEDPVPFEVNLAQPGYGKGYRGVNSYTNQELYDLASPEYTHLPYIYDNFAWEHCAHEGYDFAEIGVDESESGGEAEGSSNSTSLSGNSSNVTYLGAGDRR